MWNFLQHLKKKQRDSSERKLKVLQNKQKKYHDKLLIEKELYSNCACLYVQVRLCSGERACTKKHEKQPYTT